MGAFIVADISFAASKDRVKFEKKYNWIRKKDIILDEKIQIVMVLVRGLF